jgi:peptidoglycan/LPS O-acetylase OafA/YrhL
VSVALVLAFHAGIPFVPAGYLGVSVFFTLSGYLITGLLLREFETNGRIDLGRFWSRRLRRLLPASLTCLLAIVVARLWGAFARVDDLQGEVSSAVFQVYNWTRLAGSQSYADLFATSPSPVEHYWSLAIEEQFYWCWPLVLWGLLSVARRRRRSVTPMVALLTALLCAGAVVIALTGGSDAAYWATPARLPEILVGAALSCVLTRRRPSGTWLSWLAPCCLAAIAVLSCTWPSASGPAYRGWLPAFALLSAGLILGLQRPGVLRSMLAWRPLVAAGRISYGLYLFHWPVFVVLRERGWDLSAPAGFTVGLTVTIALATASFVLVERPVRGASWPARATVPAAVTACLAVLVAAQVAGPTQSVVRADDGLLAAAAIEPAESIEPLIPATTTTSAALTTPATPWPASPASVSPSSPPISSSRALAVSTTSTTVVTATTSFPLTVGYEVAPPRPVRMLVVGDSTALYAGEGLAAWTLAHPEAGQVSVVWYPGCTFLLEPEMVTFDLPHVVDDSRETVLRRMPAAIGELQPDVVLLMVTMNDVADRRWSDLEGALSPFDPRFVDRMSDAYAALTDQILASGVGSVAWVIPPVPNHLWLEPEMNDPARYTVQHGVIRDLASRYPAGVSVVDLDAWLALGGHATDPWWRADGVHLTPESALALAEQYLGPLLVQRAVGG